jgi:hypothetical protein
MHLVEPPVFPPGRPRSFRATVHGTVFADREKLLDGIRAGDRLTLVTDPVDAEEPAVWVHVEAGDPVGHLPPEIGSWLAPWIRSGGPTTAVAVRVRGRETPSWRRLLVEVSCP